MSFNPNDHLLQLKSSEGSKDYLPIQFRLVWFRERYPHGTIETELVSLDLDTVRGKEVSVWNSEKRRYEKIHKEAPGFAMFKATVKDGEGGMATGYGSEMAVDFTDYIEKADTKSIGRALAALGFGTQFTSDLDEGQRIADSPVERTRRAAHGSSGRREGSASPNENEADTAATEQQLATIRKLRERLGLPALDTLAVSDYTYVEAKARIQQLTTEYREQVQKQEKQELDPAIKERLGKLYPRAQALNLCEHQPGFIVYIRKLVKQPKLQVAQITMDDLDTVEADIVAREQAGDAA